MKKYLLPENGQFYKAALHCHSTVSDGALSPEEIKRRYMALGYSAVAFTDHDILIPHNELSDDQFIALNGYEATVKEEGPYLHTGAHMRVHHLCMIAKTADRTASVMFDPRYVRVGNASHFLPFATYIGPVATHEYTPAYLNQMIAAAREAGFLVHYNHPRWSFQTAESLAPLNGLGGIEVSNTDTAPLGDANASLYEDLCRMGKRFYPIAADDMHKEQQLGTRFQMIKAPMLSYPHLTAALERGDSYASEGPLISELWAENGAVSVTTSPAERILLLTDTRLFAVAEAENGIPIRFASLQIPKETRFLRIEVTDKNGNTAYTRVYDAHEWE